MGTVGCRRSRSTKVTQNARQTGPVRLELGRRQRSADCVDCWIAARRSPPGPSPASWRMGLALAILLACVARPAVVAVCLAPFRYPRREVAYIGWVDLRGAVPIVLATYPRPGVPPAAPAGADEVRRGDVHVRLRSQERHPLLDPLPVLFVPSDRVVGTRIELLERGVQLRDGLPGADRSRDRLAELRGGSADRSQARSASFVVLRPRLGDGDPEVEDGEADHGHGVQQDVGPGLHFILRASYHAARNQPAMPANRSAPTIRMALIVRP